MPDSKVPGAGSFAQPLHAAVGPEGRAAKDAARFTAAAASGKPIATVTIGTGGHTILHDVAIVTVQHSGGEARDPVLVVEFNAARIDFD